MVTAYRDVCREAKRRARQLDFGGGSEPSAANATKIKGDGEEVGENKQLSPSSAAGTLLVCPNLSKSMSLSRMGHLETARSLETARLLPLLTATADGRASREGGSERAPRRRASASRAIASTPSA